MVLYFAWHIRLDSGGGLWFGSGVRFVFLGPPASGKGTQARRLAEEFGLAYLSTGGLLRSEISKGSPTGLKASEFLDRGEYVPDSLILPMVAEWAGRQEVGWVLDGFPRTKVQAREMIGALKRAPLTCAVVLDVPKEELERRVARRVECPACHFVGQRGEVVTCPQCATQMRVREDDELDNFRSRYAQFTELTLPAVEWLDSQNLTLHVRGDATVETVFEEILRRVGTLVE